MRAKLAAVLFLPLALGACGVRVPMRTPVAPPEPPGALALPMAAPLAVGPTAASGPIIQALTSATVDVTPGLPVALQAQVLHPEGQPVALRWEAQGGVLSADAGVAVQWLPPAQPGTYAIRVVAQDAQGRRTQGTLRLVVPPPGGALRP